MKKIVFLAVLLFTMASAFSQEPTNIESGDKVHRAVYISDGKTATVEQAVEGDELSPEKPPANYSATATTDATMERVDMLMSALVSKLPKEQRETIRKSNGEMYEYIPSATLYKGKKKIKSRKIIHVMPAGAKAATIDPREAAEEDIPIRHFEVYGHK